MPDAPVVDEVVLTDEEKKAAEDAAAAEAAEAAEFEAGFTDTPTEKTPPVEEDEAAKAAAPEKEAADKAAADAAAAAAAQPKYRQITEDEWTQLQSAAAAIDTLKTEHRKELDRAFGKVGGLERTLKSIQEATPAGHKVEVTDADVADLAKEFPELGALVLKSLQSVAGKMKGTAPAAVAPDPKEIETTVHARLVALQSEELEDARPDWREVVGAKDSKTPYRAWLATQPEAYQEKLASTNSAGVIARSISKFEEAKATADKAAAAAAEKADVEAKKKAAADKRKGVLAAAVNPRTSGGHATTSAGKDPFDEGFEGG